MNISSVQLNQKNITSIIIIAVCILISFSMYQHQTRREEALKGVRDSELGKNRLFSEYSALQSSAQEFKKSLVHKDASGDLRVINELARLTGIIIVEIKPEKEAVSQKYKTYPYEIVVAADSYHLIGRFVSMLESHPDKFFVDSIKITSPADTSNKNEDAQQKQPELPRIEAIIHTYTNVLMP
jgi:Tfp pilus assembly protein PilO